MSRSWRNLPPLPERLAAGRPIMTQEQITDLAKHLMSMTHAPSVEVRITHTANVITRLANDQVLSGDDGDILEIRLGTSYDGPAGGRYTVVHTSQLDDNVLRELVARCEAIDKAVLREKEDADALQYQVQDTLVPVHLWRDETVQAMTTMRSTLLPDVVSTVVNAGLNASGFLALTARAQTYMTNRGIEVYYEETDSELAITARSKDGTSSGWGGQAARNAATIDGLAVARQAADLAKRGINPLAFEPGRRTTILSQAAVAQLMLPFGQQFTEDSDTGFKQADGRVRVGTKFFDERVGMSSDPADPDGGYCPYFDTMNAYGVATPAVTWVENGILKRINGGLGHGMPYVATPGSLRLTGGPTSVEEMISRCKEGVFVNRISDVQLVQFHTCLLTGVTRDGCFLIEDGKITHPIKNFRFYDSPYFVLNKIEAIGPAARAPMGYTAPRRGEEQIPWPLPPMVMPSLMVRDFNFTSLTDAV